MRRTRSCLFWLSVSGYPTPNRTLFPMMKAERDAKRQAVATLRAENAARKKRDAAEKEAIQKKPRLRLRAKTGQVMRAK